MDSRSHDRRLLLNGQEPEVIYEFTILLTASLHLKLRLSRVYPSGTVVHSSQLIRDASDQLTNGDQEFIETRDGAATRREDSIRSEAATSETSRDDFVRVERGRHTHHTTHHHHHPQYGEPVPTSSSQQGRPLDAWLAQDAIEDPYNAVECVVGSTGVTALGTTATTATSLPDDDDDGVPSDTGATVAGDEEQGEVSRDGGGPTST